MKRTQYAATLTIYTVFGGEYQEYRTIVVYSSLKGLEARIRKEQNHSSEIHGLVKAFIHKRMYTLEEAKYLRLITW